MTDNNPLPALRTLGAALAKVAADLGLTLMQFDCAQAFPKDGEPQEFFQAVFTLSEPATSEPTDQPAIDAAFADLQAQFLAESDEDKMQAAIDEAEALRRRLSQGKSPTEE